jgi:threonine dehydrogenase-like Zn-dependent dehydrogenase
MRALSFDISVPRYLLTRTTKRWTNLAVHGPGSGLRLRSLPEPRIPGPGWTRLEVLAAGICGTDLHTLAFSHSPSLEPFSSFPAVLGHEILAQVVEVGPGVDRVEVGQRVAVDPLVSCTVRGFAPEAACPSCAAGAPGTCDNSAEPGALQIGGRPISRGTTIGSHRDLPGGWGEQLIAHQSQLFPVSDELPDDTAVLIEPLSVAIHALLRSPPKDDEPVLVIGSGPIALGTVWALRATGFTGPLVAQAKRPHEAALATSLGADEVVTPGPEARRALEDTGARAYQPPLGPEVYWGGGFPMVFDCVGNQSSVDQALRFVGARGRIVLMGCAGALRNLDLSPLWARELQLLGTVFYGTETWCGEARHTFEVTHQLLLETEAPIQDLVTHHFPLDHYQKALRAASDHASSGAVKVVLQP